MYKIDDLITEIHANETVEIPGELTKDQKNRIEAYMQTMIAKERQAIYDMLKMKNLSVKTKTELLDKLQELNAERYSNAAARDAITQEYINSLMKEYTEFLDGINYRLDVFLYAEELRGINRSFLGVIT